MQPHVRGFDDELCIVFGGDCGRSGWSLYNELLNEYESRAPIILGLIVMPR